MSNQKKDFTRIEDLGEFIHELNDESHFNSEEEALPEIPDLPLEDEGSSSLDFAITEEFVSPDFETNSFEASADFSPSEFLTSDSFDSEPREFSSDPIVSSQEDVTSGDSFTFQEPENAPEESEFKAPENFEDLKTFSENSSLVGMATEGNPSFSILLKNVRYIEDVNDILGLLREFKMLADSEDQTRARLMRGMLLIPRISEYAAIYLCHKLRRLDIDILTGLSDEIHPPKHQERPETGIISKYNLYQNQSHQFNFENPKLEISHIIVAATSTLEGHQVVRYLGVASEHKMLESSVVEDENSSEVSSHYHELAQKLKAHALKSNSNAVVGINYQLTPIPSEFGMGGHKYRLTCTGNLVWVNKL